MSPFEKRLQETLDAHPYWAPEQAIKHACRRAPQGDAASWPLVLALDTVSDEQLLLRRLGFSPEQTRTRRLP